MICESDNITPNILYQTLHIIEVVAKKTSILKCLSTKSKQILF